MSLPAVYGSSGTGSRVRARSSESCIADSGAGWDGSRELQDSHVAVRGGIVVVGVDRNGGNTDDGSARATVLQ
jgi:hypothetical protein